MYNSTYKTRTGFLLAQKVSWKCYKPTCGSHNITTQQKFL